MEPEVSGMPASRLFCGFLEKSKKKKIAGALSLIIPTIALVVTLVLLYRKYGV